MGALGEEPQAAGVAQGQRKHGAGSTALAAASALCNHHGRAQLAQLQPQPQPHGSTHCKQPLTPLSSPFPADGAGFVRSMKMGIWDLLFGMCWVHFGATKLPV